VPLVFDAHHHVVREGVPDQEDPSVRAWVLAARATWTPPEWQVVHLSNGIDGPQDRRHSYLITQVPSAYADVPWIEVEAKGKEEAVAALLGTGQGDAGPGADEAGADEAGADESPHL
jgi:UV DNA damage endonuclease